jgi:hypothetical protein
MKRTTLPARRALLVALSTLALGVPCCAAGDLAPSSEVTALRVLTVTADNPYAAPGEDVTLRMTYADALGAAGDKPRPVQVTWLGVCVNPPVEVDEHLGCLPQLLGALPGGGASNGEGWPSVFEQVDVPAEMSGVPDQVPFTLRVPDDILLTARPTETGTVYSTAYVFFAVCAGKVRPAPAPAETGFPVECIGDDGAALGADSFVVGYTQVYVFADGRTNENPPVGGLTLKLDGNEVEPQGADNIPIVARCAPPEGAPAEGCGRTEPGGDECTTYDIDALVEDVAEVDVEAAGLGGPPVREAIWVDYYTDGGGFDGARRLVSDTATGFRKDHGTTWTPPSEAGLVSLWAVVHDTRGGASVTRRVVKVE